jgi:phosphoglycolate phosphatase-like HAD superfamily hydrolase|tara:strand:- start:526 stop:1164 length:639 start_codon:yes stop_codon:yes gene_type:complete
LLDHSVVVFDFDGTLVDSNHIKIKGFYDVIEPSEAQRNLMSSILDSNSGDRSQIFLEFLTRLQQDENIDLQGEVEFLVAKYSNHVDDMVIDAPEIEGAIDLLRFLKQKKIKIILSSATPESNLKKIINRKGWDFYFDDIFGAPRSKNDTLLHVLKKYSISNRDIFVVGDGIDDRRSAESIRCDFIPVGGIELKPYELTSYSLAGVKSYIKIN